MRKYALGVQAAAKAAGCSKTYISLIAAGKRTTTNSLVKRAIDKYVTVIEIPEPEYNIPGIKGVKNDREDN